MIISFWAFRVLVQRKFVIKVKITYNNHNHWLKKTNLIDCRKCGIRSNNDILSIKWFLAIKFDYNTDDENDNKYYNCEL